MLQSKSTPPSIALESPTPETVAQAVLLPNLTTLLNAGMGVVVVDDNADFPLDSLLVVKQSAAAVVLRLATELVGQVAAPFALCNLLFF